MSITCWRFFWIRAITEKKALHHTLLERVLRRKGTLFAVAIVAAYAWIAVHGPRGLDALLEKRREIQKLEEQNEALKRENEQRRDRIDRLEKNRSEQEMEIRKQLKLQRPGETTFILPSPEPSDAPAESAPAPAAPPQGTAPDDSSGQPPSP
jgi:cell division protein FtsB